MNIQKPEPRAVGDGSTLDFHSMFFTIQGEGPFTGHRAIFVRLAGCNLQCPGCDTEYTQGRQTKSIGDLANDVACLALEHNAHPCLVVITGGEPLRQSIGYFVEMLLNAGFKVQIESNGVFAPDEKLASHLATMPLKYLQLVISPKTSRIHDDARRRAACFKYVLDHREIADDGLPIRALQHPAKVGVARPTMGAPVYLNPFDAGDVEENQKNLAAVARSCMKHGYIAGVQMHKLMNLE